jgi:hypothetical protein
MYLKALKQTLPLLYRLTTKTALNNYIYNVVAAIKVGLDKVVL